MSSTGASHHELESPAVFNPSLENYDTCESLEVVSVNHLPLETLAEIFFFCLEGSRRRYQFDRPADLRRWRVPLSLCQVCRHWREVAISLPLLWCSLSGTGSFTPNPALIKLLLARSRGLPLSLSLEAPVRDKDTPKYHVHASKVFYLFSNEMHRWRTISFTLNDNLARQFIAMVDSKAQILEELELVFDKPSNESAEVSALLPSFPKLHKLSWVGNLSAASLRNIPFHRLTHIYMASRTSAQDVIACLSQCTMASELHWQHVNCWDSPPVCGLPQTILLHLQSLYLKGTGDFADILSQFTLPSLKTLRLETKSKAQNHKLLKDFFDRSSCPLRQFILHDIYVDQDSIVKYLTIPFLETIPDIQVYLGETSKDDVFQEMRELKDSQDTPTFRRLQISYPEWGPAFTWK